APPVRAPRGHPDRVRRRPRGELVRVPARLGQQVDESRHHPHRDPEEERVKLFDPTSKPVERAVDLAPRPAKLQGLRLGLVDNTKFNSDTLLAKLADRLARRHGMTVALTSRKRSPSHEI